MNSAIKGAKITQYCLRRFSQTACRNSATQEVTSSTFPKLKVTQKSFQIEDGAPVHLKGGVKDKILYQVTLLLIAVGLGMSGETLFKLTFK